MRTLTTLGLVAAGLVWTSNVHGRSLQPIEVQDLAPARLLAGCEVDLTGDGEKDLAILIETERGRKLVILVRRQSAYSMLSFENLAGTATLACRLASEVRSTEAGREPPRIVKTPGAFVELIYPEASSEAIVWNGEAFEVVPTSD